MCCRSPAFTGRGTYATTTCSTRSITASTGSRSRWCSAAPPKAARNRRRSPNQIPASESSAFRTKTAICGEPGSAPFRVTSMGSADARAGHSRVRWLGQRTVAAIGRQDWLDRPSYRLEHALTIAFASFGGARERVSNGLHGTWLGHPVHPILNTWPTGAVATTVALDAASMMPGSRPIREASRYALGVGIVGSVGAAVTGVADWQHTHEEARRVG